MSQTRIMLKIEGMDCEGCAQTVSHSLKRIQGVQDVKIEWRAGRGEVSFDPSRTTEDAILGSPIFRSTYEAKVVPGGGWESGNLLDSAST